MKNIVNQFIHNHQQTIGYLANLLAVISAIFACYSWLMLNTNGWLVAGMAWLACAALGLRIYQQNQRIAELNSALNLSIKTNIGLLETGFLDGIKSIKASEKIPITETAVFLQSCKEIFSQLKKGDAAQKAIDQALDCLTEYERRIRK